MDATALAAEQLLKDENFVSHVYKCKEGFDTIGIGRLVDKARGGGITFDEAQYLLRNDISACFNDLSAFAWFPALDPVRQAALINMRFQLGATGFRQFKLMIGALARGDFALAAQHALTSKWAHQTPRRAERVARMLRTGQA